MTGPWTTRDTGMCVVGLILWTSVVWFSGRHAGETIQQLLDNKTAIHASDSSTKSVQIRTDSAHQRSDLLTDTRTTIRPHVKVVHDTVTTPGHIYVDSTLANLIATDDSVIAAQARTIALQDTLIASLRVGLHLRDTRISILERQHSPRLGMKTGIAIGAVGTVAVVVVAVKVIQAFHK